MAVLLTSTASEPARSGVVRAQWANVRDASTPRCADSADRAQLVRAHGMRSPAMFYVVCKAVSRRMLHATCHVALPHHRRSLTCRSCLRTTRALRLTWSRRPRSIPRRCTHPLARSSRGLLREIGCAAGRCGLCTRQAARRLLARVAVLGDLGRGGCIVHGPLRTVAVSHLCTPPGCVGAQGDLVMAHVRLQVHGRCAPVGAETPPLRASAAEAAAASRAVAQWDGR